MPDVICICPYCNAPAENVDGQIIYPHRPDLADKRFWRCEPCKAYVGCHMKSKAPFGRLADAELRTAKVVAHAFFDPLWRAKQARDGLSKKKARGKAYRWLAGELKINPADCHIGLFDPAMCRRAVDICKPFHKAAT